LKNGHYFDQLSSSASRSLFRGCYQNSFNRKYIILHKKQVVLESRFFQIR